jgi:hypothetical protein
MFTAMAATPFDVDALLGQRRDIIRRDADGVEMVELSWALPFTPVWISRASPRPVLAGTSSAPLPKSTASAPGRSNASGRR